jgi:hypothetical protein
MTWVVGILAPTSTFLASNQEKTMPDSRRSMTIEQRPAGSPPEARNIEQSIATLQWTFAKTYPDAPHEYVLQQWHPDVFAYFQEKLRREAVSEEYTLRGETHLYNYNYPGDGYRYWIISYVLNRCRVGGPCPSGALLGI